MLGTSRSCPRCGEQPLKTWSELSDEQQQVVQRLPASAEYSSDERLTTHQWCTRCWYEETSDKERSA